MSVISSFTGAHAFLSNFAPSPLTYEGVEYPSVEHAFAAAKSLDPLERVRISAAPSPGAAKRLSRSLTLRPDWEQVKLDVMAQLQALKFSDSQLRVQLLSLADHALVEGNTWHDQVWGDCLCPCHAPVPGCNFLGELLMALRYTLTTLV